MVLFDAAHKAVHYPDDRRFRLWVQPSIPIGIGIAVLCVVAASWIEVVVYGLPQVPAVPQIYPNNFEGPHGFPVWVRYCHFFNFLFVMMLIRSGLSILADHPRLYFNDGCAPGSEWIRFTPLKVPRDRVWTAKEDARYISPLIGTPGYRHTIGIARVWHFINVHGFIVTGIFFVGMLLDTEQWRRIVPTSPLVLVQAWNTWVHYATFHLPPEPNGFYGYNALQQIAYFTVVFVFGPLAILTGAAMSPAVVNRFPWYARIFGGRQSARSIHFLTMLSFLAFIVVHVTLIVMTGFVRNMNHIVMGTDDRGPAGMYLGIVGIAVVVFSWIAAHYISWYYPRGLQHALKSVTYPMQLLTLNRLTPQQQYAEEEISPYFWPNGKMPGPQRLETFGGNRIPRFPSEDGRSCRKTGGAFARGSGTVEQERTHHHASLHSGMEWHCQVGRRFDAGTYRVGSAETASQGRRVFLVWRGSLRWSLLRHATTRESAEAAMLAGLAYERAAAAGCLWSTAAPSS